ncbi:hypothetical protein UFOVP814_32 [uncultured Caudovirales phage]|uniref:Uncharacterized protein n=1 Tax=uncultured Caudovirales phage TaxID=2100421 RepID=A0A6J5P2F5_9CAUD|nr:hypothetical protein UFOVP814_32 [uncultured Caudovirales phage]
MNERIEKELKTIDENKRRAVNALREIADKIERGTAVLYTVSEGVEFEPTSLMYAPLSDRCFAQGNRASTTCTRSIVLTYGEIVSPYITCKLEDFTRG